MQPNITNRKVVKTTPLYTIEAVFTDSPDDMGGTYYIINRETGVFEMETSIWPQALTYLQSMEDHIRQLEESGSDTTLAPSVASH